MKKILIALAIVLPGLVSAQTNLVTADNNLRDRVVNIPDTTVLSNALDGIYARVANAGLGYVPVTDNLEEELASFAEVIRKYEYSQFEGVGSQIETIIGITKMARLYQEGQRLLALPYDPVALEALLAEYTPAVKDMKGLSTMQRTEAAKMYMSIKDYGNVWSSFSGDVVARLEKMGKVANDRQKEEALAILDTNVDRIYTFINSRLEELRDAVSEYKALNLGKKKNFQSLLYEITH